ncbi:MTRF1L release factor glutamine methyltransferase-like [Mytilus californianus]|uniref:MTRF1L release factor glutamine methyltransferase-like n=1 Tax=Mytilus californianus TaxID=6549 RepID=UPI0022478483|nr:MTRF1L release factor glutamine methyltransferase-like [Mytilus californianus]
MKSLQRQGCYELLQITKFITGNIIGHPSCPYLLNESQKSTRIINNCLSKVSIRTVSTASIHHRKYGTVLLSPIQRTKYFDGHRALLFQQSMQSVKLFSTDTMCKNQSDVKELSKFWTKMFEEEGVSEPQTSAELIIAHALGKKMLHEVPPEYTVDLSTNLVIQELCQRRLQRVPVQYIIGEWDFHDLVLKMKEPVFIPRPETEELADFVCDYIKSNNLQNGKFLDIGCGSGAISLHILNSFKTITGVAIDKHHHACDLTKENARHLGLNKRLNIHQINIFQKDTVEKLQEYLPFDVVISNPPYIPTLDIDNLEPEVERYESRDALNGGKDGLDVVRQILYLAPQFLSVGGQIWLEVYLDEPEMIKELVKENKSIKYLTTLTDFTKRDRFCVLQVQ